MPYDRPYKTRRGAPADSRSHHKHDTRAQRPYHLHAYADINKQVRLERKTAEKAAKLAKRTAELTEEKMKKWREERAAKKAGGTRRRRHTRRR